MIKRWSRSIALAVLICLMGLGTVYAEETTSNKQRNNDIYPDIENHWAQEAIEALFETGVLPVEKGNPFQPDQPVSRSHFLIMLLSSKGITPAFSIEQTNFKDVNEDDFIYPFVETAYQLGIIQGDDQYFRPDEAISRQEAMTMLIRALGEGETAKRYHHKGVLSSFKDAKEISDWAESIMAYAVNKGYFNGIDTGKGAYLYPNKEATRAEAVTLIYNTLYKRLNMPTIHKVNDVDGIPVVYFSKMEVKLTAYNKDVPGIGDKTALGWPVRVGVVAVDPEVIPYGTHLYIPGYGYAVAADNGGKVKNHKIDLYMNTRQEALRFGTKTGVTVYILDPIK
jgi:3D (Asp-Asp-Asp) domain-containing protein